MNNYGPTTTLSGINGNVEPVCPNPNDSPWRQACTGRLPHRISFFQIRNALEKERETTDRERTRHQAKLEEIRDKYEAALEQLREELEAERRGHTQLNASVNKIKKVGFNWPLMLSLKRYLGTTDKGK